MSITSKEIAKICGVSQGTVDRALNNRSGISSKTKEKILRTASEMGYRPHLLARSLVKGKTRTLGVVVFDLYNRFFSQVINSIEAEARKAGYFSYLTLTNKDKDIEEQCIHNLVDRRVDGLILCSVREDDGYRKYLKSLNLPIVTIGNRISPEIPFVGIDDFISMKDAVYHLVNNGYQKIIYVSSVPLLSEGINIYAQKQRFLGFQSAAEEFDKLIEFHVSSACDFNREPDTTLLNADKKTAVLCSSDITALNILNHFEQMGINIPKDIGIMGFDNIDTLEFVKPRLTTVAYPFEELGSKTVETVIGQIENNNSVTDHILKHNIMVGNSLKYLK